jgi:hypothetical protein
VHPEYSAAKLPPDSHLVVVFESIGPGLNVYGRVESAFVLNIDTVTTHDHRPPPCKKVGRKFEK